ncbi:hypothetical protein IQ273_06295 [Nodosilinea sp. LEGE 07298]|uniref:hypothetical protein n=1 Tax=Nodosilinea sp. LEGE 07298 TaxID=2777970 RepID=UPI0018822CC1|nr:hypothetical protein [Nodosilinea sp. LEGE 07298]MBE9109027.1 hypothetical protein [Nodosilinea sp. LEGE 07298]
MFEYQEPDANDDQGTESLPLPPSGTINKGTRSPNPEKVRHMLYGSLAAIDRTIKILHSLGYADANDWSEPMPAPVSGAKPRSSSGVETRSPSGVETRSSSGAETWMAILTKTLLIE